MVRNGAGQADLSDLSQDQLRDDLGRIGHPPTNKTRDSKDYTCSTACIVFGDRQTDRQRQRDDNSTLLFKDKALVQTCLWFDCCYYYYCHYYHCHNYYCYYYYYFY
nr:hypothetical protein BaRGS_024697 [Batillaria attramentaria]